MSEDKEVDIFRDTLLRYAGYANEVGEAFRALTPKAFVIGTYVVASGYVLADATDKAIKANKKPYADESKRNTAVAVGFVDSLVWQAFASVIVPGFTINRTCAGSLFAMEKVIPKVPLNTRKWLTTFVGLGMIPLIIHPIDNGVHYVMDKSIRLTYPGE